MSFTWIERPKTLVSQVASRKRDALGRLWRGFLAMHRSNMAWLRWAAEKLWRGFLAMHNHNVAWLRQWRVFRVFFDGLARAHETLASMLGRILPKGLYARALLIIIVPIVILQSVLAFVFMERHWQQVTRQLSIATTNEIATLISIYEEYPHDDNYEKLTDIAREKLGLIARVLPDENLPEARPKPFFDLLDRTLSREIRRRIRRPFWIDTVGKSRYVEIRVKLDDAVMQVLARRNQTYASNSHIFLLWMVGTSLVLLIVAVLFLRNQIRPVLNLADAAQRFGRGQPAPEEFKVRGAREVRLAAQSFIEMRDRIERHVEQRTTMLAGVSHDLRTVLTRFRLQLAMLGDRPEAESLSADIDEMQQMLEDYLAFAKGDAGEEPVAFDLADVLQEVADTAGGGEKAIALETPGPLELVARRNAIKRAVLNLAANAARFAETIRITAQRNPRTITVNVEDDGPGIPIEQREDVFRPFFGLDDSRNQNVKSTGLGLSIARDIVRGHGGDITLGHSQLGGLKATIRLPVE
jgi:two-component system osmolarity sensor histidine kinase EnvZ